MATKKLNNPSINDGNHSVMRAFRFTPGQSEQLNKLARKHGLNSSEMLRKLIQQASDKA